MKIISRVMALFVVALFAGCAAQTGGGSTLWLQFWTSIINYYAGYTE